MAIGPLSSVELTWNEALSGAFGSISLASWIFLLVPQLAENYQQGSADGISLAFLLVWFVGDVANLAGALWAGLVPTVVALAVYFCVMDGVLITQCVYYRFVVARRARRRRLRPGVAAGEDGEEEEEAPLLRSRTNESNRSIVGGRRRSSEMGRRRRHSERQDSLTSIAEEMKGSRAWVKNTTSIVLVCVAGAAGWLLAWQSGVWSPVPAKGTDGQEDTPMGAEILGYTSAVLYLGARIPQIIKNQQGRSCEGLSLLFFILSLLGNASYGAGILFHSIEKQYVLINLPWLIGSLGTMAEDVIIFVQFHAFGDRSKGTAVQET